MAQWGTAAMFNCNLWVTFVFGCGGGEGALISPFVTKLTNPKFDLGQRANTLRGRPFSPLVPCLLYVDPSSRTVGTEFALDLFLNYSYFWAFVRLGFNRVVGILMSILNMYYQWYAIIAQVHFELYDFYLKMNQLPFSYWGVLSTSKKGWCFIFRWNLC